MTFALEEINRDRTLLPGVKLGYSVFDSCRGFPWALRHALKLVAGNANSCNLTAPASAHENAGIESPGVILCPVETRTAHSFRLQLAGHKSAPLLIGGAASGTSILLSSMLMPFSVPVVSLTSDHIFLHKTKHIKATVTPLCLKNA